MADWECALFGNTESVQKHQPVALTIGNFDGVHKGHQQVIRTLKEISQGAPTVALTFDPHPSAILSPENTKQAIVSLEDRVGLLLGAGIDTVAVQHFDRSFSALTADQFIDDYLLKQFNISCSVIGFDFCYGSRRQGDWLHFRSASERCGFVAKRADPLIVDGSPVSSSRIRSAIGNADFSSVQRLLGREFSLSGVVVKGDQRGRLIGFPTANLGIRNESVLLPPHGVYAVEVQIEDEQNARFGIMNCGVRPTIASGLRLQIETHILDFSGDLYGRRIVFRPRKFIRTEMKFSSLEHLKKQIQSDSIEAKLYFGV